MNLTTRRSGPRFVRRVCAIPVVTLTLVHVSSPQAPRNVFLKTKGNVAEFAGRLRADHIAIHLPATGPGSCTTFTKYAVELTYRTGRKVLLLAYECKGAITGNLTGNVKTFVKYLASLVS